MDDIRSNAPRPDGAGADADSARRPADPAPTQPDVEEARRARVPQPEGERGGSGKAEPTRFGDWEVGGRCSDF
jgi:hypothetical protein